MEVLRSFPDNIIDLTVSSPPYDSLRSYKGYSFDFENIAKELYRVTKPNGVVIWVVGDGTVNGGETGTSFEQALYFKNHCGFTLFDTMIYEKANFSMPQKNRYHQIFEYMFVFSKGKPKTFNPIVDKENKWAGHTCLGENTVRRVNGEMQSLKYKNTVNALGRRTNIWRMNTVGQENMCRHLPHPAMFPKALARDHIISWSNEGDLVLDPFVGSGTTSIESLKLKRNYIGIDISDEYCKLTEQGLQMVKESQEGQLF